MAQFINFVTYYLTCMYCLRSECFFLKCIKCELHVWSVVPFHYKNHSVAGVIARKDEIIQEQEEIIRQREEDLQSLLDQISQREKQIKDLTGRYTAMFLDWLQSFKQF